MLVATSLHFSYSSLSTSNTTTSNCLGQQPPHKTDTVSGHIEPTDVFQGSKSPTSPDLARSVMNKHHLTVFIF
ncbi:hypothetical protein HanRHA438_Chr09g0380301 [Helianthus annuus]|nr:hypothetical protein HanIR_Chr09g0397741 [Helianthus annuus]KAJ0710193.1 hypothetical protein HanOQP8_Chr09g0309521 [Helianthus annuus]KAJ0886514.1 hypothetical protein HanRHA438_Chr09g0380301 [Helianthus annuus]